MQEGLKVKFNGNSFTLCNHLLEKFSLTKGDHIQFIFDEESDTLLLKNIPNTSKLHMDGYLEIPKEPLEEMTLPADSEFYAYYDGHKDCIIVKLARNTSVQPLQEVG